MSSAKKRRVVVVEVPLLVSERATYLRTGHVALAAFDERREEEDDRVFRRAFEGLSTLLESCDESGRRRGLAEVELLPHGDVLRAGLEAELAAEPPDTVGDVDLPKVRRLGTTALSCVTSGYDARVRLQLRLPGAAPACPVCDGAADRFAAPCLHGFCGECAAACKGRCPCCRCVVTGFVAASELRGASQPGARKLRAVTAALEAAKSFVVLPADDAGAAAAAVQLGAADDAADAAVVLWRPLRTSSVPDAASLVLLPCYAGTHEARAARAAARALEKNV